MVRALPVHWSTPMSPTDSVAQVIAETAAELDDAFELPDPLPSNVYFLRPRRTANARPTTIAECVPLMAVATEFLRRGPDEVNIGNLPRQGARASDRGQAGNRSARRDEPRRMGRRRDRQHPDRAQHRLKS
jgi:hypothetical protein